MAKKQSTFIDLDTKTETTCLTQLLTWTASLHSPCPAGRKLETFLGAMSKASEVLVHHIDGRCYLVWFKWLIFIAFSGQLMVSLVFHLIGPPYSQYQNWKELQPTRGAGTFFHLGLLLVGWSPIVSLSCSVLKIRQTAKAPQLHLQSRDLSRLAVSAAPKV